MKKTHAKLSYQSGMASILITMITMIVISLIVLGFASISRREQGQTLDRQLSTQAFYAAESGVEDARHVIKQALSRGDLVPAKAQCDGPGDNSTYPYPTTGGSPSAKLAADGSVQYSCLTVDPSPTSLQYTGLNANSTVVPIRTTAPIDHLTITWSPHTTPTAGQTPTSDSCPANASAHVFKNSTQWKCLYGVMRMDIVDTDNSGGPIGREKLTKGMIAGFFSPGNGATEALNYSDRVASNYSSNTNQPAILRASCNYGAYDTCTATLTGFGSSRNYTLRLLSMYQASDVTIQAFGTSGNGNAIELNGAQAEIDVTGKAQDVLRRIQVRMPINTVTGEIANYAIQSGGSLCKRFYVAPGFYKNAGDVQEPDTSNQMCDNSYPAQGTP